MIINSYTKNGDPTISTDPDYYDVYVVELTIDNLSGSYPISPFEAEVKGEWNEAKALTWLEGREEIIKTNILEKYEKKLENPQLDKIEHPNFTIQYNPKTEHTELITSEGTIDFQEIQTKVDSLEASLGIAKLELENRVVAAKIPVFPEDGMFDITGLPGLLLVGAIIWAVLKNRKKQVK